MDGRGGIRGWGGWKRGYKEEGVSGGGGGRRRVWREEGV